jgi:hypothetical protein
MFHGLTAYSKKTGIYGLISKAKNCIGNEICTSDKPIGNIGVFVSGEIISAYSNDCWSYLNGKKRVTDVNVLPADDLDMLKSEISFYQKKGNYKYSEIFFKPSSIDAIWVKNPNRIELKMAKVLARKLKTIVIHVSNDSNALNW